MRVIFRAERTKDGEVTAVLPDVEANYGEMTCYAHVGQHSACTLEWYHATRAAKPAEYADLLEELQDIYDNKLVVRQRILGPIGGWRK